MAYRLKSHESIARGLERIVDRELRSAIDHLATTGASQDAIHEVRKSIKKVRAIVQLVGRHLHARHAARRLHAAGKLLAPVRDAQALTASLKELCVPAQGATAAACSTVRERFEQRRAQASVRFRRHVLKRVARQLEKVRKAAHRWHWKRLNATLLTEEIGCSYQKAARAMKQARGDDTFHAWRKRVKVLWYGLRLLPRRSKAIERRIKGLEKLETLLGEEHDLAVLRGVVWKTERVKSATRVMTLARRQQRLLRERALKLGTRQLGDALKPLTRHIERAL